MKQKKGREAQTHGNGQKDGQNRTVEYTFTIPQFFYPGNTIVEPLEDEPEILQVVAAPTGLHVVYKQDEGNFNYERVDFLALTRRLYRGKFLFELQPMVKGDFGYELAEEYANFYGIKDFREVG